MDHSKMDTLLEKMHMEIMTLHNKERQDSLMEIWHDMMEWWNTKPEIPTHKEPEVMKNDYPSPTDKSAKSMKSK